MLMSATALVLSAISAPAVADVTPASLAAPPPLIELCGAANCDTVMSYANGGKDHVPDCGFD
jgi:hypothetical protein